MCESYICWISHHLLFCREVWPDYTTVGWFFERYFEKISRGWTNSKSKNIWHLKMYVNGHRKWSIMAFVITSSLRSVLPLLSWLLSKVPRRNQAFAYFAPWSWNNLQNMLQLNHFVTMWEFKALLKTVQLKSVTSTVCTVFIVLCFNVLFLYFFFFVILFVFLGLWRHILSHYLWFSF